MQNVIVEFKDFKEELNKIESIIKDFKMKEEPVMFIRNVEEDETSSFYKESRGSKLHDSLKEYADIVIEKTTPSGFYDTNLNEKLEQLNVNHVFVTGFNTEFCCQFTAIAAYDRGYQLTFIEDATGTVNDEEIYEMKGLDVKDFVGIVLHWSNVIKVLDFEEYKLKIQGEIK